MLELRDYQQRSLDALEQYLSAVAEHGAQRAFVLTTNRPYVRAPSLPGLPYVCLRVPTGGGKTLMAAHALGIAARVYLRADRAVCLWLVPSNTIREQTLKALGNREHPYRQVLDARFAGNVRVVDLSEALYIQRATLDGDTVILVSTLQALRREDTEGLKVYEQAGVLKPIIDNASAVLRAGLDCYDNGEPIPSLANVLRLYRPLVLVDEAHNARTPLSFDTLARLNPSCIVEFTATPQTEHRPERELFASNVLHHVSAAELKAADMIKLPIKLQTHAEWKEVIGAALAARRELEDAARDEERYTGEYIRPLVLFQAQARSQTRQTLTVEVVRQCLIDDFKISEDEIAIATGQTRELDDVDLFDRGCKLRYIITVQALKEGWDCSFAYVLCSVADIHSSRAVEQLLGRVLRMPRATRKQRPELNHAYTFAASPQFVQAAQSIRDTLVENLGFQRIEAADFVRPLETAPLWGPGTLFAQRVRTAMSDFTRIAAHLHDGPERNDESAQSVRWMEALTTLKETWLDLDNLRGISPSEPTGHGSGASKDVSQPMAQAYVYCRSWYGFAATFPFDRFNTLPDDEIVPALEDFARQWLREHRRDVVSRLRREKRQLHKRLEAWERTVTPTAPPGRYCTAEREAGPRTWHEAVWGKQWRQQSLAVRVFRVAEMANIQDFGLGGFSPSNKVFLPQPYPAGLARELVDALQVHFSNPSTTVTGSQRGDVPVHELMLRFGCAPVSDLSPSQRALIESAPALPGAQSVENAILQIVAPVAAHLAATLGRITDPDLVASAPAAHRSGAAPTVLAADATEATERSRLLLTFVFLM